MGARLRLPRWVYSQRHNCLYAAFHCKLWSPLLYWSTGQRLWWTSATTSSISLCNTVDSKKFHFVMQSSLLQPTFSSSLGILWQWPQRHHDGECPAGSWELVHDRFPSQNLAVLRLPVWSSFFKRSFSGVNLVTNSWNNSSKDSSRLAFF